MLIDQRPDERPRQRLGRPEAYAVAAAAVIVAAVARSLLGAVLGDQMPFALFLLAVIAAASYGGLYPGLAATAASLVLGSVLFLPPESRGWLPQTGGDQLRGILFTSVGITISLIFQWARLIRDRMARSEASYRLLAEGGSGYAIFAMDGEGSVLNWNAAAERIHGYSQGDIVGRDFRLLYTDQDRRAGVPEALLRSALQRGSLRYEGWRVRKDGSRFWAQTVITALYESPGHKLRGLVDMTQDLTERRQTEENLRESEATVRGLLESASQAILGAAPGGRIVLTNATASRMFGYSREELTNLPIDALLPERSRNGTSGRGVGRRRNGDEFPVEISSSSIETQRGRMEVAFVSDATERAEHEGAQRFLIDLGARLARQVDPKDLARTAVSSLAQRLVVPRCLLLEVDDHDRGMLTVSAGFYRGDETAPQSLPMSAFGAAIRSESMAGQTIVIEDAVTDLRTAESFETGFGPWNVRSLIATPLLREGRWVASLIADSNDPRRWTSSEVDLVRAVAERTWPALENARLLAEVRRLNRSLEAEVEERTQQLREVNAELEAFSYSVSHDLRAPLRSIEGFTGILQREYENELDEEAKRYFSRISSAALRMGQLIEDLLKLSRISRIELRRERVDLSAMAQQIIADLRHAEPDRDARIEIQDDLVASADARLSQIVLENLLGNAWKFTRKTDRTYIHFGAQQEEGETVFFVRDNGAGFDMTYAKQLFAPFQRLHRDDEFQGTGIGLATVHRIIRKHGGRIWPHARPGAGAAFYFTLQGRHGEIG